MNAEKSPGVLLQAIPYLGQKRILKVFTPENGLLSLMAGSSRFTALTSPFCIAEWVYQKGKKEIDSLKDGTLVDPLLNLRQDYAVLSCAGAMAQDLLRSQLPGKKAPDLYNLFCTYLKHLPTFAHPQILSASFRLKLLLHEGLLSLHSNCSLCDEPACHLFQGESYCLRHALYPGITLTPSEWAEFQLLAFARQFSLLQQLESAPLEKVKTLFEERLSH